ncbi:MAG: hypothetical protein AAF335_02065, partial [Bacteroidota bacterium]
SGKALYKNVPVLAKNPQYNMDIHMGYIFNSIFFAKNLKISQYCLVLKAKYHFFQGTRSL